MKTQSYTTYIELDGAEIEVTYSIQGENREATLLDAPEFMEVEIENMNVIKIDGKEPTDEEAEEFLTHVSDTEVMKLVMIQHENF